jgi:Xaa-Pro aminopeptidase
MDALPQTTELAPPFDTNHLDRLMAEADLDVLLVTSKHVVQYLTGGHRAGFFDTMDAIALSRYLPVLVYPRSAPHRAAYIGHRLETHQRQATPFWPATARTNSSGSTDAIEHAAAHIRELGVPTAHIGIEPAFLPYDSAQTLARAFPAAELVDAIGLLDRLRMNKTEAELALVREATERVTDAMAEAFAALRPGMTKRQLWQRLREAEVHRDLTFDYCLLTAGPNLNRAVADQVIEPGDVISLDSGGNYRGYIGDIARMGILGEPDAELVALLDTIDAIQRAAFAAVRPGALGGAIYDAAHAAMRELRVGPECVFLAHGMGLVSHEAPRLTRRGLAPTPGDDSGRPLEPGMVVSIETTWPHPGRGFIKLEDTVAVTAAGYELYGDRMRGWTRV